MYGPPCSKLCQENCLTVILYRAGGEYFIRSSALPHTHHQKAAECDASQLEVTLSYVAMPNINHLHVQLQTDMYQAQLSRCWTSN